MFSKDKNKKKDIYQLLISKINNLEGKIDQLSNELLEIKTNVARLSEIKKKALIPSRERPFLYVSGQMGSYGYGNRIYSTSAHRKLTEKNNLTSTTQILNYVRSIEKELKDLRDSLNDIRIENKKIVNLINSLEPLIDSLSKGMSISSMNKHFEHRIETNHKAKISPELINEVIDTINRFIELYNRIIKLTKDRKINGRLFDSDLLLAYRILMDIYEQIIERTKEDTNLIKIVELYTKLQIINKIIEKVNNDLSNGDILRIHLTVINQGFIDLPTGQIDINKLNQIVFHLKSLISNNAY